MRGRRLFPVMSMLMLVEALSSLEVSMIYTALPTIMRAFPDPGQVGWLLTSYLLIQAGSAAIGGRLGDILGHKRVLIGVVVLCGLGSAMSAATDHLGMIIAGRAIQGVSGAILPLCYSIAREVLPREKVPFWVGALTGAYALLTGVGYVLGGVLAEFGSWHAIFYFAAGYAALLVLPAWFVLPDVRPAPGERQRIDLVGGLLFVPGLAAVLIAVSRGGQWGWASPATITLFAGGAAVLAIWVRYELRVSQPLVDVRLLARREIRIAMMCQALNGLGLVHTPLVMMLLLQQPSWTGVGLGIGASVAGLLKLPSNIASGIASPINGAIFARHGGRAAVVLAGAVAAVAWTYLWFRHDNAVDIVVASVLGVSGCAMMLAAVPNVVLDAVDVGRDGEVTGLAGTTLGAFSAVGAQICATLLATDRVVSPAGANFPSEAAFSLVIGYIVLVSILLILLGLTIAGRVRPLRGATRRGSALPPAPAPVLEFAIDTAPSFRSKPCLT